MEVGGFPEGVRMMSRLISIHNIAITKYIPKPKITQEMSINDYFNRFLIKIFGVNIMLIMEDTAYVLKREKHPE